MGGICQDHIVQLLRTLFCLCNQVMFQHNAASWKSNQIILSDSNIVLHILKDVVILQFFSLVLASHTLDHEPITVGGRRGGRRQLLLLPHSGTGTLSICQKLSRSPSEKFSDILKQQRNSFPDCKKSHHLTSYFSKVSTSSHSHPVRSLHSRAHAMLQTFSLESFPLLSPLYFCS